MKTLLLPALMLALGGLACDRSGDRVEPAEPDEHVAEEPVIPAHPVPAKSEYVSSAKERLRKLDAKIGQLEREVAGDTSQQAHDLIRRLHEARNEARRELVELERAAGERWEDLRERVHEQLVQAELRYREIEPKLRAL